MPQRTLAHRRQREFFSDLSYLEDLVLTTKNGDPCALNIHGTFELFDKHWVAAEDSQDETMLALKEDRHHLLSNVEPRIHFHIDWDKISYACIRPRRLELINSDYEIVFCDKQDPNARIFWFYFRDSAEAQSLRAKWGDDWINLKEAVNCTNYRQEAENVGYAYF